MTDLAHYIKRELAGLLRRIDETPPKRYHSLAKLRKLISTAPIDPIHKQDISSSLTAVQSALVASTTRKGRPCKQYSVVKLGDSYIKHLQF